MRHRKNRLLLAVAIAPILATLPAAPAFAQPSNDDLANATPVSALGFTDSVDATGATLEAGEPDFTCAPVNSTVWYAVTLDRKTTLTIDTAGSDYDTVLSVFRGTGFPNFDLAACNDDAEDLQARVSVSVGRGETVYVQVGAFGDEPGAAGQLEISFTRGSKQATKKPLVFKSSFRGHQAFAEWFTGDEDAFSDTFAVLTNGRAKFGKGKPTRGPALEVFHFAEEFDPVTETFTVTDFFGFTTLSDSQFHIDRKLRSASVDADLTLEGSRCVFDDDSDEGEDCEFFTADVAVSITWDGVGSITRSRFSHRESGDDFRFTFRSRTTSREALADGSITGDVNLVSGPADFAVIARSAES